MATVEFPFSHSGFCAGGQAAALAGSLISETPVPNWDENIDLEGVADAGARIVSGIVVVIQATQSKAA